MKTIGWTLLAGTGLALAGCATTPRVAPVEVMRYHLGAPLPTGTISVDPTTVGFATSIESQIFTNAVASQLMRYGYTAPAAGTKSDFLAVVGVTRTRRDGPPKRSPISIGIGGGGYSGGYSGGVGVGGGVSFPVGSTKYRQFLVTDLSVQIRRRSDGTAIWEGHAQAMAEAGALEAQADAEAARLADALFRGFPGDSGRTIEVR